VAHELTATQRAFLQQLATALETAAWDEDALQAVVFNVARLTPLEQPRAFQAIYRVLLARESGPKAGNLLAFLDRAFVIARFRELSYAEEMLWNETAITPTALETWLAEQNGKVTAIDAQVVCSGAAATPATVLECIVTVDDGKAHMKRVAYDCDPVAAERQAREHLERLVKDLSLAVSLPPQLPVLVQPGG